MRKYEAIWEQIKKRSSDADAWTHVNVADSSVIQTIINMVQTEKSEANVTRKRLDLPAFGRLEIDRQPLKKRVSFRLKNSGAAL